MLEGFLKVAYEQQRRETWTGELSELLKQLPVEELRKIASGVTIKEAYGDCMPEERQTFLDKFKGSPLIEQAIALEQEEIQADMLSMQKREERRTEQQAEDSVYDMKDQIRLKRRLLELQLAKEQAGVGAAPGAQPAAPPGQTAQGAGALGDVPAEGVQDSSMGVVGGKTASLDKKKFAFAEQMGRTLAREEAAQFELQKIAAAAGAVMAKEALNLGSLAGLAGKVAPMAGKALGFAAKNPTLTGAAVGAAGGALAGGPGNRLAGAAGGAALGAGVGHAAGGIGKGMAGGKGFLESAKGYGQGLAGKVQGLVGAPQPSPQTM